jgi:hypothetical protein
MLIEDMNLVISQELGSLLLAGYRFNRAIIFPANRFHAATKHFGGDLRNGRIYQLFTFHV